MEAAYKEALNAYKHNEVPVGAVLVKKGMVVARAHNQSCQNFDFTHHGELLVIQQACRLLNCPYLDECDLYVTLEPCVMCCGAISLSRIRRVYFGAYDPKFGGIFHNSCVFNYSCVSQPQIIGGVFETKCQALLKDFFQKKRKKLENELIIS